MSAAISIVVIGKDEEARVTAAIESALDELSHLDLLGEVIYVDSGSIDNSARLAARAGAQITSIPRATANAAKARNAGLSRSRARWIHFVDVDMTFIPGWLAFAVAYAEENELDALGGTIEERLEGATLWSRVFGYDWNAPGSRGGPIGGAGLWKRSQLFAVGGFDESLDLGEDPDLCRRMTANGFEIQQVDRPMVTHALGLASPFAWWRRAVRVGRSAASVVLRHQDHRLAWQRFGQPIVGAALLVIALLIGAQAFAVCLSFVAALMLRRAWLDHRGGLPVFEALAHGVHVYAVKFPQLLGGVQTVFHRGQKR